MSIDFGALRHFLTAGLSLNVLQADADTVRRQTAVSTVCVYTFSTEQGFYQSDKYRLPFFPTYDKIEETSMCEIQE